MAEERADLERRVEAEIVEPHEFLEQWFRAQLDDTDADYARFADSMAAEMRLLGPDGALTHRDDFVPALRKAHGKWRRIPGRIWIDDVELLHASGQLLTAVYKEFQEENGLVRIRHSTVVFRQRPDRPNGLEWLHLHETWAENP